MRYLSQSLNYIIPNDFQILFHIYHLYVYEHENIITRYNTFLFSQKKKIKTPGFYNINTEKGEAANREIERAPL